LPNKDIITCSIDNYTVKIWNVGYYRITGFFLSGNLILTLLAVVLVTLKIINANKTFTISMNKLSGIRTWNRYKKNHSKITSPDNVEKSLILQVAKKNPLI
jgi:hypothetical protein